MIMSGLLSNPNLVRLSEEGIVFPGNIAALAMEFTNQLEQMELARHVEFKRQSMLKDPGAQQDQEDAPDS